MMPPIDYLSGARCDFDESFDWYAERIRGSPCDSPRPWTLHWRRLPQIQLNRQVQTVYIESARSRNFPFVSSIDSLITECWSLRLHTRVGGLDIGAIETDPRLAEMV